MGRKDSRASPGKNRGKNSSNLQGPEERLVIRDPRAKRVQMVRMEFRDPKAPLDCRARLAEVERRYGNPFWNSVATRPNSSKPD